MSEQAFGGTSEQLEILEHDDMLEFGTTTGDTLAELSQKNVQELVDYLQSWLKSFDSITQIGG